MIIALAQQKGGTGKTTTAAALIHAAAEDRKRVLAIDADPQGNLTFSLGGKTTGSGTLDFVTGSGAGAIHTISGFIDLIPGTPNLATLTAEKGAGRRLQEAILPIKERYDCIIIDSPPTAGILQYAALQAADLALIPLSADPYSIQALYQISETIQAIRANNPGLKAAGLFCNYDGRAILSRQMHESIAQEADRLNIPILGTIRAGIAAREAAALQQSLFSYAPKSKPAQDYRELYKAIKGVDYEQ